MSRSLTSTSGQQWVARRATSGELFGSILGSQMRLSQTCNEARLVISMLQLPQNASHFSPYLGKPMTETGGCGFSASPMLIFQCDPGRIWFYGISAGLVDAFMHSVVRPALEAYFFCLFLLSTKDSRRFLLIETNYVLFQKWSIALIFRC